MIRYITVRVRIDVEPDEDHFYAYCPELKGVHVEGSTEDEAAQNAKDAAEAYILSLLKNNDPLPLCARDMSVGEAFSSLFSHLRPKKAHSRYEDLEFDAAVA